MNKIHLAALLTVGVSSLWAQTSYQNVDFYTTQGSSGPLIMAMDYNTFEPK